MRFHKGINLLDFSNFFYNFSKFSAKRVTYIFSENQNFGRRRIKTFCMSVRHFTIFLPFEYSERHMNGKNVKNTQWLPVLAGTATRTAVPSNG